MIFKKILLFFLLLNFILITAGCAKETQKITYKGPDMMETFQNGDILTVSLLPYNPKQGDIVAIQLPIFEEPVITRIIALEGQTVDFDFENWFVYVDGEILDEPYVLFMTDRLMHSDDITPDMLPIKIEPGKIFVMGDNRNLATDSRTKSIGQVDVEYIIGNIIEVEYILTNPINPINQISE